MGNTAKQAPDPKLQKLGMLRVALCIIAAALCGSIVVSAVNLRQKPKELDTDATETTETVSDTQPTDNTTVPTTPVITEQTAPDESAIVPAGDPGKASSSSDDFVKGNPVLAEDKGLTGIGSAPDDGTPSLEGGEGADAEFSDAPGNSDSEQPAVPDSGQPAIPGSEQPAVPDSEQPAIPSSEQPEIPDSEQPAIPGSEQSAIPSSEQLTTPNWPLPVLIGSIALLALDAIGIGVCSQKIQQQKRELRRQRRRAAVAAAAAESEDEIIHTQTLPEQPVPGRIAVGSLQNIGGRPYQEDSSGVANLSDGVLAVVADGMGGLSNGDKVSQKIIFTMMGFANTLRPGQMDGVLSQMVKGTVDVVNRMLGKDGLYKSGSTLMAVLVRGNQFHWIAVGDSHIYLLRDGQLIQLNQEHNRGQDLLRHAIAGDLTFDEVRADPKKSGLTSFIGMGEIKYVEKSLDSISIHSGDRIVLMTDGVFNALSDGEIAAILTQNPDVKTAARVMEQGVLSKAAPHQDNFTAVILGL